MQDKHKSAVLSLRGILGFVAALGITNTLLQFLKMEPDPIIHLTSLTTHMAKATGPAPHCTAKVCIDLGLERYAPLSHGHNLVGLLLQNTLIHPHQDCLSDYAILPPGSTSGKPIKASEWSGNSTDVLLVLLINACEAMSHQP